MAHGLTGDERSLLFLLLSIKLARKIGVTFFKCWVSPFGGQIFMHGFITALNLKEERRPRLLLTGGEKTSKIQISGTERSPESYDS